MTREESLKLANKEETPYYFQSLINKIYDEFENKSCNSCIYIGKSNCINCLSCSRQYTDNWRNK